MYTLSDSDKIAQKVSKKIKGWYYTDDSHNKAVERIVRQREEIYSVLNSVTKYEVKKLLKYLDSSGFFYRPSSDDKHHNFPGGLAEHSLGVFRIAEDWNNMNPDERRNSELYRRILYKESFACDIFHGTMDADDMVIAALCHDLCKAKHFYFRGRVIEEHLRSDPEFRKGHSILSVKRLKANGIFSEELLLAVLTHMKLFSKPKNLREEETRTKGRKSMLAIIIWAADKLDASRHSAGRRHSQ